jgi:phosphoglycolate phosphatase
MQLTAWRYKSMTIKACIFDLDGTLNESQASIARPVNMTLELFGLPAQPVEAFNYFAGNGLKTALKRALIAAGDTDAVHLEEGWPVCKASMEDDPLYLVHPYPYIPEVLRLLKANGIKTAVLTNKVQKGADKVISTIYGDGLFDIVQGETDTVPVKPDPAGAMKVMAELEVTPDECLYFGDTNVDMQTAHNAGIKAIGVTWGFRTREELEETGADLLIDDARDIPGLAGISWQGED